MFQILRYIASSKANLHTPIHIYLNYVWNTQQIFESLCTPIELLLDLTNQKKKKNHDRLILKSCSKNSGEQGRVLHKFDIFRGIW